MNRTAIRAVNCADLYYTQDKRQSGLKKEAVDGNDKYRKADVSADFECFALQKNCEYR